MSRSDFAHHRDHSLVNEVHMLDRLIGVKQNLSLLQLDTLKLAVEPIALVGRQESQDEVTRWSSAGQ